MSVHPSHCKMGGGGGRGGGGPDLPTGPFSPPGGQETIYHLRVAPHYPNQTLTLGAPCTNDTFLTWLQNRLIMICYVMTVKAEELETCYRH